MWPVELRWFGSDDVITLKTQLSLTKNRHFSVSREVKFRTCSGTSLHNWQETGDFSFQLSWVGFSRVGRCDDGLSFDPSCKNIHFKQNFVRKSPNRFGHLRRPGIACGKHRMWGDNYTENVSDYLFIYLFAFLKLITNSLCCGVVQTAVPSFLSQMQAACAGYDDYQQKLASSASSSPS